MFKCAPEDPYTKWDKLWLDRARVILQARKNADLARTTQQKKRDIESDKNGS